MPSLASVIGSILVTLVIIALVLGIFTVVRQHRNRKTKPSISRPLDPEDNWVAKGQQSGIVRKDPVQAQGVAAYISPQGHVETSGFYDKTWQQKMGSWYGRSI